VAVRRLVAIYERTGPRLLERLFCERRFMPRSFSLLVFVDLRQCLAIAHAHLERCSLNVLFVAHDAISLIE
jgi:hypothetical protein